MADQTHHDSTEELEKVNKAITAQEALLGSGILPDEQLEATLAALRQKQVSLKAELEGSGAIALGEGATAVGERGVSAGDVQGNIITGDVYYTRPTADPADTARQRYLKRLRLRCNALPLPVLGGKEAVGDEVSLDQVYVALDTLTQVESDDEIRHDRPVSSEDDDRALLMSREGRRLSALEAATRERRLALLGEPGGGKSSFVRQLSAWLGAASLGERDVPEGWQLTLPVLVVLRDLAPRLAKLELKGINADEKRRRLLGAVWEQWRADLAEFNAIDMADQLDEQLADGMVLLIFDGLDEVAESVRERVGATVKAILQTYGRVSHVIVTCRTRSYDDEILPGFKAHTLAPFDRQKIDRFVKAWYMAQVKLGRLDLTNAEIKIEDLQSATNSTELAELAANPMLLTTMALIHQREVGLPKERVRLYSQAVSILLNRWQKRKGIAVSPDLATALEDGRRMRAILERLAYEAHRMQGESGKSADLTRKDILVMLEDSQYLGDVGLAAEFLDYVDRRAGLLVGRGGIEGKRKPQLYDFPHRTFQEYLAGCYMITGRDMGRKFWQHASAGEYWYLAAQLGVEELLYNNPHSTTNFLDLAYELCPESAPQSETAWRALVWSGYMAAQIERAEIERDEKPGGGQAYIERLLPRLVEALESSKLAAAERAEAGCVLARLGEIRAEVMDVDALELCYVPAGPFYMGSDEDPEAEEAEKPLHGLDISYAYWTGRYPVTNAQYEEFVKSGGYEEEAFWPEAAAAGLWRPGQVRVYDFFQGDLRQGWRSRHYDFGPPFNLANHPVVGVSWYEALAFCRWLSERWADKGWLPDAWRVTLPSESEWEKAARGGLETPTRPLTISAQGSLVPDEGPSLLSNPAPRRIFPWGDEAESGWFNGRSAAVEATSTPGCFPLGSSPYGCQDLSGNVWEWTHSLWGDDFRQPTFKYPYDGADGREDLKAGIETLRILRGGSCFNEAKLLRCACRIGYYPLFRDSDFGFRVVVSPLPGP